MVLKHTNRQMTVADLIARLQTCNPDALIAIPQNREGNRATVVVNTRERLTLMHDHAGGEIVEAKKRRNSDAVYAQDEVVLLEGEYQIGDEKPWEWD